MGANSVASSSDGSLLATIPLHTGNTISEALAGNSMSRHPNCGSVPQSEEFDLEVFASCQWAISFGSGPSRVTGLRIGQ